MAPRFFNVAIATALAFTVGAQDCPIQFDGRIPETLSLSTLDTSASPYQPKFVFGAGLKWSEIALFPDVPPSLFDSGFKAIEVTINDSSIFAPSPTNIQTGFRRAELLPASNNGTDPSTLGLRTLHFSLRTDTARPLNYSHEYQLVFVETNNFATNQFALKTGSVLGGTDDSGVNAKNGSSKDKFLKLVSNIENGPENILFETPFLDNVWHNFGLILDFDKNTTQTLYSVDLLPLVSVTGPLENDLSGQGEFHFGILKKPTGNVTDITKEGYQESGIHEGIVYGGIFEERSEAVGTGPDCVSLL